MSSSMWQVLVVEDSDDDTLLIERELRKTQRLHAFKHVKTEPDLLAALGAQQWDIVLCDYNMPELGAVRALELIRATDPYVPFLVVSGSIGEDATVEIIRAGAQTYVSKDRLRVLGETVRKEIERATARATSMRTLRAREDELSDFLDNAGDLIQTCDFDGNIEYTNRRWHSTLAREDEPSANLYDLVHPASKSALLATLEHIRATGVGGRIDLEFIGPQHEQVWLEGSLNCRSAGGKTGLIRGIWRDITDRKQAAEREHRLEKQLHEAQKMEAIGRLAGGVAHDFNNLLTVIFCSTQSAQDMVGEGSPIYEELSHVTDAARRARDLTAQLLTFSNRGHAPAAEQLDMRLVIAGLAAMLGRILGDDVDLQVDAPSSLPHVAANIAQVEQVIVNLAVNARDAMPEGGRLLIRAQPIERGDRDGTQSFVRVEVCDSGTGMTPEHIQRAFEPFYTTKPPGKGTGLGLSTVYGILQNAGGEVRITSTPGEGTLVTTHWPVAASNTQLRSVQPAEDKAPSVQPAVILVVDDEPAIRRVIERALRGDGHTVYTAGSAAAALQIADKHGDIDLLVSDVVMPGGSGRDLANRLRERWSNLPILFISGHLPEDDMLTDVLGDLRCRLLNKPFSPSRLRHVVREQLAEPRGIRD